MPFIVSNRWGDDVTAAADHFYVLSEYIPGRLYERGTIPGAAARSMGEILGKLHCALETVPSDRANPLPRVSEIEGMLRSLLAAVRARTDDDPLNATATAVLEAKLDLLSTIREVPVTGAQWTHGDYEWRNLLFDDGDHVAAVIDFDEASFYSPARDVMRCIALSFPDLPQEVEEFFGAYASIRRLTVADAVGFVDFYRYISTFRFWPIAERYLHPERYEARWDEFIQPFLPWDWERLKERLLAVL